MADLFIGPDLAGVSGQGQPFSSLKGPDVSDDPGLTVHFIQDRFEDCLAFCELTEEEIDAIAEHEHLPEMVAVEFASYLIQRPDGEVLIRRMIVDDIQSAHARGNVVHAAQLKRTLLRFIEAHQEGSQPGSVPVAESGSGFDSGQ